MAKDDAYPTPGLRRMKRKTGRVDFYWICGEDAARKGYPVKTVALPSSWELPQLSARCVILQQELRQWLANRAPERTHAPAGTVSWLCRSFETDEASPFHELRPDTRRFYSKYAQQLVDMAGDQQLDDVTGSEVRRWYREWEKAKGKRSAYAGIQTLRRVVSYGCELRNTASFDLAKMLERMEFKAPRARKMRPTHEQITAVRAAAHEAGRPSIALAVALQFELGLRQKDVIGEWRRLKAGEQAPGAITDNGWIWDWGLTWNHISARRLLQKPTSKSNGEEIAEHDLNLHPQILAELPPRLVGPIVVDERSGLPWRASHFSHTFRKIARAAGWPDGLWNMDSRAGAVSEAFDAGADPVDVMRTATHTQMTTTMLYARGAVVQSSRVAELRAARRRQQDGG